MHFFPSFRIERVFRHNLFLYLISDFVFFSSSRLPISAVQFFRYRCSTIKWNVRKGLFSVLFAGLYSHSPLLTFFHLFAPRPRYSSFSLQSDEIFINKLMQMKKINIFLYIYRSHWFAAEYCSRQNSNNKTWLLKNERTKRDSERKEVKHVANNKMLCTYNAKGWNMITRVWYSFCSIPSRPNGCKWMRLWWSMNWFADDDEEEK